VILITKTFKRH